MELIIQRPVVKISLNSALGALSIHWTFSAPGAQLGWTAVWRAHSLAPIMLGSAVLFLKGSLSLQLREHQLIWKGPGSRGWA